MVRFWLEPFEPSNQKIANVFNHDQVQGRVQIKVQFAAGTKLERHGLHKICVVISDARLECESSTLSGKVES